jgi:peptide/nickel transport system ATP-binding protein
MTKPLLEVEDLRVRFHLRTGTVEAVRGVSFQLGRERLGIVGESGSGKSQTGRAILGLTPPPGEVTAKRLAFDGIDLLTASKRTLRTLRGGRISMVMQDPKYSLNPVMTIGEQIIEAYQAHIRASRAEARDRTLAMLEAVKMRDPARVFALYPHEVSGGMGLIFISHDLKLVSSFCNRVLVMYAGHVVEEVEAKNLREAKHPYTQGLMRCLPTLANDVRPLPTLNRDPAWAL